MVRELGVISVPSGKLFIVDPSYLSFWCDDRPPTMPAGVLSSPEATALANDSVDLEITGRDAIAVGKAFDRQWNPRFLFDIPRAGVAKGIQSVAELARARGLEAEARETPTRVTHRRRMDLALEAGGGAGEVQFHGMWSAIAADLPSETPLRVLGDPLPEGHPETGRLRTITIVAREGVIATSARFAYAMVDAARLLAIDAQAVSAWRNDDAFDGKADFVFWGRDAEKVAALLSAPRIGEGEFGWCDLPVAEAEQRAREVLREKERGQAMFATDYRPHSHMFELMKRIRSTATESGIVTIAGTTACGFATTWGDGIFDVYRDVDAEGRLLRVRIELATDDRVALFSKLRLRWKRALVSRLIADGGKPIRFLYRQASDHDDDSGWRIFSGEEDEHYNDDPANIALVTLADVAQRDKRVDALLDAPVGSVFECRPGEESFQQVTDWEPEE
jgi:hypothetical protein